MSAPSDERPRRRAYAIAINRASTATSWLLSTPWALCLLLLAAATVPASYYSHPAVNMRLLLLCCALGIAGTQLILSVRAGCALHRARGQARRRQR